MPEISEYTERYCPLFKVISQAELGCDSTQLVNTSALIPLAKNSDHTEARPIAVPTGFRRLAALMCLQHWRPTLAQAHPSQQHGALQADGALRFATSVQAAATQAGHEGVFVRLDIANAFGSIDRRRAIAEAASHAAVLAKALTTWLSRPSLAALRTDTTTNAVIPSSCGIPQGDPLSSVLFCIASAPALRMLNDPVSSPGRVHAYVVDSILITTAPQSGMALLRYKRALQELGLRLNDHKTAIWGPNLSRLPGSLTTLVKPDVLRADALVICGLPIQDPASPGHDEHSLPLGTPEFIERFLGSVRRALGNQAHGTCKQLLTI